MTHKVIVSAPYLLSTRCVKSAIRAAVGSSAYPSILQGNSIVQKVPILSKVLRPTIVRPSIELLSTPSLISKAPSRYEFISHPKTKIICRKGLETPAFL